MDSAMRRLRFSRRVVPAGVCGSEWTAVPGSELPVVALLLGARQRRLGLGLKGAGKVGLCVPSGSLGLLQPGSPRGSGPTEAVQRMPLVRLGSRPSGRLSNVVDCLQCSAIAAGRWGGDLVPCAWDVGGHMGPSDPS